MPLMALTHARSYDWQTWVLGIFRSFLSGGAGALVALGGSVGLKLDLKQTLILTGGQFVVMGLYRMGEFLTLHGGPDEVQAALDVAQAKTEEAGEAIKDAKVAATPKAGG